MDKARRGSAGIGLEGAEMPEHKIGTREEWQVARDELAKLEAEQAEQIRGVKEIIDHPPEWLQEWSGQIGAELKDGLREGPSWIAFARENGTVYHTYTVMAPDPFVAPYYSFLLERTPKPPPAEPRTWRKDEYPD